MGVNGTLNPTILYVTAKIIKREKPTTGPVPEYAKKLKKYKKACLVLSGKNYHKDNKAQQEYYRKLIDTIFNNNTLNTVQAGSPIPDIKLFLYNIYNGRCHLTPLQIPFSYLEKKARQIRGKGDCGKWTNSA